MGKCKVSAAGAVEIDDVVALQAAEDFNLLRGRSCVTGRNCDIGNVSYFHFSSH